MAARTWIADSTKNWSDVTAWDGGVAVPATTDTVTFNSTHVGSCTADAFGTWTGSFTISSGYTGTITKSAGVAWTSTSTFSMAAGTFNQGTGAMTSGTTFTISGGAFNKNNSGNFTCTAFSCTGGTFTCSGTGTFTCTTFGGTSAGTFVGGTAAMSTGAVTFSGTASITATSAIWSLAGSWTQSGSTTTFAANSGTISVTANCTFNDARSTFNLTRVTGTSLTLTISTSTTLPFGTDQSTGVGGSNSIAISGTLSGGGVLTFGGGITVNSTGTISGLTGVYLNASSGTPWSCNASGTIPASFNVTFNHGASASTLTFTGGGKSYGTVRTTRTTGNGAFQIGDTGNTINLFRDDDGLVAHSIKFLAGSTTNIANWSVKGSSGFLVTINTTILATVATLHNTGTAPFESDWISVFDVAVDATPYWFAGWNSTISSGSTVDANWKMKGLTKEIWDEPIAGHVVAGSFGEQLQPVRRGTAQAGAAGTITLDASASAVDSFYNGAMAYIVSGTGAGQARAVTGYVGSTKVATVSPTWVTNPDSTSVFVLWWMANADTYQVKVTLDRDSVGTTDRYSVAFFKNGQPVVAGITSPTIQVIKQTDGSDLVASTALTQVASTGLYKYTDGTNRVTVGAAYYALVTATIDGSSRTWNQPVSRDS